MKQKDILAFAIYDLRQKKRFRRRMIMGIGAVEFLLIFWFILQLGLASVYESIENENISDNSLIGYVSLLDEQNSEKTILDAASVYPERFTGEAFTSGVVNIPEYLSREDWIFVNMKYVELRCEEQTFCGENDYSYDFDKIAGKEYRKGQYSVPLNMAVVDSKQWLGTNDLEEYYHKYKDAYDDGIIAGRNSVDKDQIIISDYMLEKMGIERKQYETLIGKKIDISCDGIILLKGKELVGIVDSRLFYLSGIKGHPQVILGIEQEEYELWGIDTMDVRLPIRSYSDAEWLWTRFLMEDYGAYSFTAGATVSLLDTVATTQKVALGLLNTFGVFICVIVLLGLVCFMGNDVKSREYFYGLLNICGMNRSEICTVHLYEVTILWLYGFIVGALSACMGDCLVQNILNRIMGLTDKPPISSFLYSVIIGGGIGLIFFVGIEFLLVFFCLSRGSIRRMMEA